MTTNEQKQSSVGLEPQAISAAVDRDAALLAVVRREMDRSCAALDGHTLSRLHTMRAAAVAKQGSRWTLSRLFVPFGGLVTACALVVVVNIGWNAHKAETTAPAAMEDIELLADKEALDLYADYEFYQWLAQN